MGEGSKDALLDCSPSVNLAGTWIARSLAYAINGLVPERAKLRRGSLELLGLESGSRGGSGVGLWNRHTDRLLSEWCTKSVHLFGLPALRTAPQLTSADTQHQKHKQVRDLALHHASTDPTAYATLIQDWQELVLVKVCSNVGHTRTHWPNQAVPGP